MCWAQLSAAGPQLWSRAAETETGCKFSPPISFGTVATLTPTVLPLSFPPTTTSTFPPGDIKGIESKTKTPAHPHRAAWRLCLDVYHAWSEECSTRVPSELLHVFVESQGLESMHMGCVHHHYMHSTAGDNLLPLWCTCRVSSKRCLTCKITRIVAPTWRAFPPSIVVICSVLFVWGCAAGLSYKMSVPRSKRLFTSIQCIQYIASIIHS